MSKKIIGCNGKKISRKKMKKFLKKSKKDIFRFFRLCGMSKTDIRVAMLTGEAPDFVDTEKLEELAKEVLGAELCDQMGI